MKESNNVWKWVIIALVVVLLVPVVLGVLGVLTVTPVRVRREPAGDLGPTIVVVEQKDQSVALSEGTPPPGSEGAERPTPVLDSPTGTDSGFPSTGLSLNPQNATLYVLLPALAGLAVLACALLVSLLISRWKDTDATLENGMMDGTEGVQTFPWPKVRYVLLGLALWIGLSLFLLLDLWSAVSLFTQFVVIYAAFWALVGLLLLIGRPWKEKLLILGLFVVALVSIRFIDWNSRKPFLKDLGQIEAGMTVSQVDLIMSRYQRGPETDQPPILDQPGDDGANQANVNRTWVTYRHTNEGWGNSDWGVVGFQDGAVFETRFLPD